MRQMGKHLLNEEGKVRNFVNLYLNDQDIRHLQGARTPVKDVAGTAFSGSSALWTASVPVGKYKLFFGLIRKGKKQQVMKSLILPGRRTPAWIAEAGKTTVVPFGAPYSFDFSQTLKDGMLTVKGSSVTLIGASFERYERLWNCVAKPELAWRKAGTKRGSKPEKFPILEDLNARDEQGKSHDPGETFHPLDLTVETKLKDTEGVEVQLIEKKNKLFGAIESAWHK